MDYKVAWRNVLFSRTFLRAEKNRIVKDRYARWGGIFHQAEKNAEAAHVHFFFKFIQSNHIWDFMGVIYDKFFHAHALILLDEML